MKDSVKEAIQKLEAAKLAVDIANAEAGRVWRRGGLDPEEIAAIRRANAELVKAVNRD